ncbi:MAG: phosphoenolpyruvate carboxykinase (ATP) [Spirosomaceae bacterium]|jgi:phosphoenolpyruvate carboxykinase (ATP)|nr:phosphoenolpyruvate carboxykinase (ATP) [Spirosomataceae bacterium]
MATIETPFVSNDEAIAFLKLPTTATIHFNLSPEALVEQALQNGEGQLADTGALAVDTGEFTGRSPQDRFIVYDEKTADSVWWSDINIPFDARKFDKLHQKMLKFLAGKKVYVRQASACAHPDFQLNLTVVNTWAWHNLFCYNMFLRPTATELQHFQSEFTIINIPEFEADPKTDGTRSKNFAILDMTRNIILIGGTGYAGEMKKGVFSVLNYKLPHERGTLSMHCSANVGKDGDTALFFGLSGTGKTTLSADPTRALIGDDEHGWAGDTVFNFEGGCYAKVVNLTREKEPDIFDAIKTGTIVENTRFFPGTHTIDYTDISVTQNTRTAYPIDYIANIMRPSRGEAPQNIFFLATDSFGVLPPIAKLTTNQAMYHFISGYTAKIAGTEMGVKEPQATFSNCFGAAFLPLHPTRYARLLGQKILEHDVNVWLINTGWTGGGYGVGSRMNLAYTRAMIAAALGGELESVEYVAHPVFGVMMPTSCPNVPSELLNPRDTWADPQAYDLAARKLADMFRHNFSKYAEFSHSDIAKGGPIG